MNKVLEPLEHSVLDHADPAGQHAVIQEVLEPLEHSVLDAALDGRPMEGIPVLDPLEHSVLEMALDGGPLEEMSNLEPLEHSVLNVALDGRPMEGIPVLEPLEHSVLEMALDSRLMEGMSVVDVVRYSGDHLLITIAVSDPLEHSGLSETDDVKPGVVLPELLEHSVLVAPRNEGDVSVVSVDKLDPIEHLGVVKWTETISAYLPQDAGRHVTIEPSGMVPKVPSGSAILVGGRPCRGWRTEAWSGCWGRRPDAGSSSSASGRKY